MRRPRHVKHQPIGSLKPYPGAIPPGPSRQYMQKPQVRLRGGGAALQIGAKGARIGKPHATVQPHLLGLGVQAVNPVAITLTLNQRERRINRACAHNPFAGQSWKPQ